jgi:hypothetical protein
MSWLKKAAPYIGFTVLGIAGGLYLATTGIGLSILGFAGPVVGTRQADGTYK